MPPEGVALDLETILRKSSEDRLRLYDHRAGLVKLRRDFDRLEVELGADTFLEPTGQDKEYVISSILCLP